MIPVQDAGVRRVAQYQRGSAKPHHRSILQRKAEREDSKRDPRNDGEQLPTDSARGTVHERI